MHTAQVINLSDRFTARRTLSDIDENGVAIRARNAARAHGPNRNADRCAEHALNVMRMRGNAEEAIAAAKAMAIQLADDFDGGSAA